MPFYAVHKGKRRGIYTDWLECKQNIFGVRHPIFKKFNTKEEAEHFLIHGFGTKTNQSMRHLNCLITRLWQALMG